ncbi:hypothetical protein MJM59_29380, partial [Salmonella enterica subsp. enterica serovar Montevideo]|nr:hypothetical protein [Salmonella enterica subsp. enterica serovar Montevideo]
LEADIAMKGSVDLVRRRLDMEAVVAPEISATVGVAAAFAVNPKVDIFVPTYNEDLNVVKNTIYASLGIDWPKDKLNIWILDDGGR